MSTVGFVLMWKRIEAGKGETVIAIDQNVLSSDSRISVSVKHGSSGTPGSTLTVAVAKREDAGQYICEMGNKEHSKIKHTVQIRGKKWKWMQIQGGRAWFNLMPRERVKLVS